MVPEDAADPAATKSCQGGPDSVVSATEEKAFGFAKKKREDCSGCGRPQCVCVCSFVEGRALSLASPSVRGLIRRVVVFSHPLEGRRKNNSVRLLQLLLPEVEVWVHRRPGCCPHDSGVKSKPQCESQPRPLLDGGEEAGREGKRRKAESALSLLDEVPSDEAASQAPQRNLRNTHHLTSREGQACVDTSNFLLLFPRDDALPLGEALLSLRLPATLLVLDGTWKEAREMLKAAPWLREVQAVRLPRPPQPSSTSASASSTNEKVIDAEPSAARGRCGSLRLSGVYSRVRTPPEREAASGGVCTAEAVAEALSFLGKYGRSADTRLLSLASNTRALLREVVELNQVRRFQKNSSR